MADSYKITPAAQAEITRISVRFHVAMVRAGLAGLQEAYAIYGVSDRPPKASWLERAVNMVLGRRRQTRDLGMSYYCLVRALSTGTTIYDPQLSDSDGPITLGELRARFEVTVKSVERGTPAISSPKAQASAAKLDTIQKAAPSGPRPVARSDDARKIVQEKIARLDKIERAMEKAAEQEVRDTLELKGDTLLQGNQRKIAAQQSAWRDRLEKMDKEAEERDKAIKDRALKDHRKSQAEYEAARNRVAQAAERLVQDGARDQVHAVSQADNRCIGYVRVSRTGKPCGWCAMLISRGLIFYKSKMTATGNRGGFTHEDLIASGTPGTTYHDNCHCYAQPVFSREQYFSDKTFEQNRKFAKLWPKITEGLGGKDAIAAFRKHFRNNTD